MTKDKKIGSVSRRGFLVTTGSLIAVAPAAGRSLAPTAGESPLPRPTPQPSRKIPIGCLDSAYGGLLDGIKTSTEEMIDKLAAIGCEAVELGTGGSNPNNHVPMAELLADPAKAKAWQKKFTDKNIQVFALAFHSNPLHPDPAIAAKADKTFRDSVLLAERCEVPVLVGFTGLPAGGPDDKVQNWILYPGRGLEEAVDYQWNKKAIPYWKEAAKFAREHNCHKIALETHPNQLTYNAKTILKLREAVGEEIGANCDFSHQFWQGVDPVEVIRFLGSKGAIYHCHMKDTTLVDSEVAKFGVLNPPSSLMAPAKGEECSFYFSSVGYGHRLATWQNMMKAYMDTGFPGMLSVEAEDSFVPPQVCVERTIPMLLNMRAALLKSA